MPTNSETLTCTAFHKIGQPDLTLLGHLDLESIATHPLGLCIAPPRNASTFKTKNLNVNDEGGVEGNNFC